MLELSILYKFIISIVGISLLPLAFEAFIRNAFSNEKYRIKEIGIEETFYVQVRKFCFWITIKKFHDTDPWWANANAKNLLDELNKEL